ncbi:MAG TPA: DUF3306 domain-containing protein [Xanthobacteraceae bacterium]|nr:DUF3306 domain-containing protein [Xanthobacteraceae bacterium]
MSEGEGFLRRWSRRKRAAAVTSPRLRGEVGSRSDPGEGALPPGESFERPPHPDPLPEGHPATFASRGPRCGEREPARTRGGETAPRPPVFDPGTLPPIESIDAGTDVRAFLRPGVPPDLARAALRRAWRADPAIRDFVGPAENALDFTAPGGVPGFEPLRAIDDVQRLAALITGAPAAAPEGPASAQTGEAEGSPAAPAPSEAALPAPPSDAATQDNDAAMQKDELTQRNVASPRRRHGGALAE